MCYQSFQRKQKTLRLEQLLLQFTSATERMVKLRHIAAVFVSLSHCALGQVAFKSAFLRPKLYNKLSLVSADIPTFTLPLQNNARLLEHEHAQRAEGLIPKGEYRFGKHFPVKLDLSDGQWW
jgi:hypothetical protein